MSETKPKTLWGRRVFSALWGGLLGLITGTAISSALARIVQTDWLRFLLVDGLDIKVPPLSSSLGFFSLSFGFGIRLTLLSAVFTASAFLVLLLARFKNE